MAMHVDPNYGFEKRVEPSLLELPDFVSEAALCNSVLYPPDLEELDCEVETDESGFITMLRVGDVVIRGRGDSGYPWFCHEVFCKTLFGHQERPIPTHVVRDDREYALGDVAALTPDNFFAYQGRLFITEVKTSFNRLDMSAQMFEAKTKYLVYEGDVVIPTGITVGHTQLNVDGLHLKAKSLKKAYKNWLSARAYVARVLDINLESRSAKIPKARLADFPEHSLTYDKTWQKSIEEMEPKGPLEYRDKFNIIPDQPSVLECKPTKIAEFKISELPNVLPTSEGVDFPSSWDPRDLNTRRLSLLRNFHTPNPKGYVQMVFDHADCMQDVCRGLFAKQVSYDYTGNHLAAKEKRTVPTKPSEEWNQTASYLRDVKVAKRESKNYYPHTSFPNDVMDIMMSEATRPLLFDLSEKAIEKDDLYPENYGSLLWTNTKLFQMTMFLQRLVEELNANRYSAMGSNTQRMKLSKVGSYDAYVFTCSTGNNGPLFFDLLFHGELPGIVSEDRKFTEVHDGWFMSSKIFSVDSSRLEQLMTATYRLCSLATFYRNRFPAIEKSMYFMSYLILMDGKQRTIDWLQYFRYIYMKKTSVFPGCESIKRKVDEPCRTWLQAYIKGSLHSLCDSNTITVRTEEDGSVHLKDVKNWITGIPISGVDEMVTLSYMHYVVPAKSNDTAHAIVACLSKIIKEEELVKDLDIDAIKRCDDDFLQKEKGSHEYSRSFISLLANQCYSKIASGGDVKGFFDNFRAKAKLEMKPEKYATMKRTTSLVPGKHGSRFERKTCAEAMLKMDVKDSVLDQIAKISESLVDDRERVVTIFKKDQQTGIREIFVMGIKMRLTLAFSELFFKCVGELLPNEMISTPHTKDSFDMFHRYRVESAKVRSSSQFDMSTSSDAKTWCQRWIMPAFCDFVWVLFGKMMESCSERRDEIESTRNIIINGLNSITHKLIFPEESVMKTAMNTPEDVIFDPTYRILKNIASCSDLHYITRVEGAFHNYSNMMQGVPHVLSSVIHACYLNYCTPRLENYIKNRIRGCTMVKISSQVSSDDSSILATVKLESEEDRKNAMMATGAILNIIEYLKPELGAKCSDEKSTIGTVGRLKEFNSCWTAGYNTFYASIKFATAVFTMGYHVVLRDRVSEALSSMSQLYKEGLQTVELGTINKCLQLMHARMLCMVETEEYTKLLKSRSPQLGVVPYLPPHLVGLFSLEILCPVLSSVTNHPGYSWGSKLVPSLSLDKNIKYRKFVERMNIDRGDLVIKAMKDPKRFIENGFVDPSDNIRMKVLSPGITLSFARSDLLRIQAASCFASNNEVIRTYCEEADHNIKKEKLSLLIDECLSNDVVEEIKFESDYIASLARSIGDFLRRPVLQEAVNRDVRRKRFEVPLTTGTRPRTTLRISCINSWVGLSTRLDKSNLDFISEIFPRFDINLEECIRRNGDILVVYNWLSSLSDNLKKVSVLLPYKPSKDRKEVVLTNLMCNYSMKEALFVEGTSTISHGGLDRLGVDFEAREELKLIKYARTVLKQICCPFRLCRERPLPTLENEEKIALSEMVEREGNIGPSATLICKMASLVHKEFETVMMPLVPRELQKNISYWFTRMPKATRKGIHLNKMYYRGITKKSIIWPMMSSNKGNLTDSIWSSRLKALAKFLTPRVCEELKCIFLSKAVPKLQGVLVRANFSELGLSLAGRHIQDSVELIFSEHECFPGSYNHITQVRKVDQEVYAFGIKPEERGLVKVPICTTSYKVSKEQEFMLTDAVGNVLTRSLVYYDKEDLEKWPSMIWESERQPQNEAENLRFFTSKLLAGLLVKNTELAPHVRQLACGIYERQNLNFGKFFDEITDAYDVLAYINKDQKIISKFKVSEFIEEDDDMDYENFDLGQALMNLDPGKIVFDLNVPEPDSYFYEEDIMNSIFGGVPTNMTPASIAVSNPSLSSVYEFLKVKSEMLALIPLKSIDHLEKTIKDFGRPEVRRTIYLDDDDEEEELDA